MTKPRSRPQQIHELGIGGQASHAIQDYVKTIYKLAEERDTVSPSAIAAKMGISAASVTGMVKKLVKAGLVTHGPTPGVVLTESGRRVALEMIRHHRLIELYLQKALGFTWDKVDAEAERLEHVLSEDLEAAMAAFLGDPMEDPHGDPIPTKDGYMPLVRYEPLTAIAPGQAVRIRRVKDSDADLLRYLGKLGLYPHTVVEVIDKAPFDGPLVIRLSAAARAGEGPPAVGDPPSGSQHSLGAQVTDSIFVERLEAVV